MWGVGGWKGGGWAGSVTDLKFGSFIDSFPSDGAANMAVKGLIAC